MPTRRVVVADRNGKSAIVSDEKGLTNAFAAVPGFDPLAVWATAPNASLTPGGVVAGSSLVPPPGGTTLFVATFPPDSVMASPDFDPNAAGAEYGQRLPGLAEQFEQDNPGMHRTSTIDYDIVLSGELWCELDDGEVHLKAGDVLVLHGARHAWRNKGTASATIAFLLIGVA